MSIDDPMFDGIVQVRISLSAKRQTQAVGAIVRTWFERAWRELGGSIRQRVLADPPTGQQVRWGLHVQGEFFKKGAPSQGFDNDYSRWPDLLDWLGEQPFDGAGFRVAGSDGGGTPLPYYLTDDYLTIEACWDVWDGHQVVQLIVESKEDYLHATKESQTAVIAFLVGMLQEVDADYAEAGFGYGGPETCVDSVSHTLWPQSAGQARETLRGYGWLTYLPPSLVSDVGGIDHLRESGAFVAVRESPHRGVLLQATDNFQEFDDDKASRIFELLRGVLRPHAKASAFRRKIQARGW